MRVNNQVTHSEIRGGILEIIIDEVMWSILGYCQTILVWSSPFQNVRRLSGTQSYNNSLFTNLIFLTSVEISHSNKRLEKGHRLFADTWSNSFWYAQFFFKFKPLYFAVLVLVLLMFSDIRFEHPTVLLLRYFGTFINEKYCRCWFVWHI